MIFNPHIAHPPLPAGKVRWQALHVTCACRVVEGRGERMGFVFLQSVCPQPPGHSIGYPVPGVLLGRVIPGLAQSRACPSLAAPLRCSADFTVEDRALAVRPLWGPQLSSSWGNPLSSLGFRLGLMQLRVGVSGLAWASASASAGPRGGGRGGREEASVSAGPPGGDCRLEGEKISRRGLSRSRARQHALRAPSADEATFDDPDERGLARSNCRERELPQVTVRTFYGQR